MITGAAFSIYFVTVEGSVGTESGSYTLIIATDAVEDYGNTLASAFEIVDPVNGTLSGVLDYNADIDMFKFIAPGSGLFSAGTNNSLADSYGSLYDAAGNILAEDDDSGPDSNFLLSYYIEGGHIYYFQVNSYNFVSRFSYTLKLFFPEKVYRTTSILHAPTPVSSMTTNTNTETSSFVKPENDLAEQNSTTIDYSGLSILVAIFVAVILGTIILACSVSFFVQRRKSSAISTEDPNTTMTSSNLPSLTEKYVNAISGPLPTSSASIIAASAPDSSVLQPSSMLSIMNTTWIATTHELSIPAFLQLKYGQDFRQDDFIARGGCGAIYHCSWLDLDLAHRHRGVPLAVKHIAESIYDMNPRLQRSFWQELSVMWRFRDHPNFCRMYGYSVNPVCMVMKFYSLGDLSSYMKGQGNAASVFPYTKQMVLGLFRQCASAIAHMHQNGLVHCDVKPANVLLHCPDEVNLVPIVTDFGITRVIAGADAVVVAGFELSDLNGASCAYAAPEVFHRFRSKKLASNIDGEIMKAGDIYALAITIFEMLTRQEVWKL